MPIRLARGLVAATAAVAVAVIAPAGPATAAAGPVSTQVIASPASEATQASTQARALRREVATMLTRYLDDYGDRFTEAERQQLEGYRANADRQLAAVVAATSRLSRSTSAGTGASERRLATVAAKAAWKRAKTVADSTWTSARQIMEPRLSLFEKLGALRDYDAMMSRFADLGDRITAASAPSPA